MVPDCVSPEELMQYSKTILQPSQFHMLSPKRICWLKVKITLITHAHVVNIVVWYNFINPIHCHSARSATRRQKYNIGWK